MAARRIAARLRHILDAATAAERLVAGKSVEDYRTDSDLAAAVERYLERLSEASRHIPQELEAKHPAIDWRGVADIGNVLRHAYDQVSDRRVLDAVTEDLPALKAAVEAMLAGLGRERG
jgi:uncharacterized protein with HEPN domain